jgi:hypothetical protein
MTFDIGGNMNTLVAPEQKVDEEWLKLIIEAKKVGLTIEQIKEFLRK